MSSFNKITIVGYLGRDPVLRYTPSGQAVCDFSIATSERRSGNAGGEAPEITTWFKVTLWGKQAENANQYLSKGKQVYVEGRLRQTEYTDREGMKRTSLEVTATDLQFISARGGDESGGGSSNNPPHRSAAPPRQSAADQHDDRQPSDDDIPF
ncbi:MAG: single-stranded DNA-binding protein [Blastocatellia bacterium]